MSGTTGDGGKMKKKLPLRKHPTFRTPGPGIVLQTEKPHQKKLGLIHDIVPKKGKKACKEKGKPRGGEEEIVSGRKWAAHSTGIQRCGGSEGRMRLGFRNGRGVGEGEWGTCKGWGGFFLSGLQKSQSKLKDQFERGERKKKHPQGCLVGGGGLFLQLGSKAHGSKIANWSK